MPLHLGAIANIFFESHSCFSAENLESITLSEAIEDGTLFAAMTVETPLGTHADYSAFVWDKNCLALCKTVGEGSLARRGAMFHFDRLEVRRAGCVMMLILTGADCQMVQRRLDSVVAQAVR